MELVPEFVLHKLLFLCFITLNPSPVLYSSNVYKWVKYTAILLINMTMLATLLLKYGLKYS